MGSAALSYAIDDRYLLTDLDGGYHQFAAENGWEEAASSLGRSLWDYVAGSENRTVQRLLVRRIRDEARRVELPFRCDAPATRREMTISIAAVPPGRLVRFSARLEREVEREFQPLLDPDSPRSAEQLEMCGWCDRFRVEGEWLEVEEATARLELFAAEEMPAISHGLCGDCDARLRGA